MERIENRTFDEIKPGDTASLVRTLTHKDIELFAVMSGDINPTHLDDAFAKSDLFHKVVAHGMWSGALISTVLGTQLPGRGPFMSISLCTSWEPLASVTRSPSR
jgi:acyl dehydratase